MEYHDPILLCSSRSVVARNLTSHHHLFVQALHEARIFIEREFEEVCEEANLAEKLHSLDVLCAEQGIEDRTGVP